MLNKYKLGSQDVGIDHSLIFGSMADESSASDFEMIPTFKDFCTLKFFFLNRENGTYVDYNTAACRVTFLVTDSCVSYGRIPCKMWW